MDHLSSGLGRGSKRLWLNERNKQPKSMYPKSKETGRFDPLQLITTRKVLKQRKRTQN